MLHIVNHIHACDFDGWYSQQNDLQKMRLTVFVDFVFGVTGFFVPGIVRPGSFVGASPVGPIRPY